MMKDIFWMQDARAIVVTQNALEAEDLAMTLQDHQLSPVMMVHSVRVLRHILSEDAAAPHLVVIGVSLGAEEKWAVIAQCKSARCRVLVIDGDALRQQQGSLGHVTRPFTSTEVELALQALHLIPESDAKPSQKSG